MASSVKKTFRCKKCFRKVDQDILLEDHYISGDCPATPVKKIDDIKIRNPDNRRNAHYIQHEWLT